MYYPYPVYGFYNIVGLAILLLDLIAIASVLAGKSSVERKILWTLVILVLPVVGMILYYTIGRKRSDIQVPS